MANYVAQIGETQYETIQAAVNAVKDGETIMVLDDIELTDRVTVTNAVNFTIDLNQQKITRTGAENNGSAFDVQNGKSVTITNGKIDCSSVTQTQAQAESGSFPPANECDAITARKDGTHVILNDVDITVNSITGSCAYAANYAHITVESGCYRNLDIENSATTYPFNPDFKAMIFDQANHNTRLIEVKAGEYLFNGQSPSTGDDSGLVPSFLSEDIVASITGSSGEVTYYTSLQDAVNAAMDNQVIQLLRDIELTDCVFKETNTEITIDFKKADGGSYTITRADGGYSHNGSAFDVKAGSVNFKNASIDLRNLTQTDEEAKTAVNECDAVTVRSGATANFMGNTSIQVNSITGSCAYAFEGGCVYVNSPGNGEIGSFHNEATGDYPFAKDRKPQIFSQAGVETQCISIFQGTYDFIGQDPATGDDSGLVNTFLDSSLITSVTNANTPDSIIYCKTVDDAKTAATKAGDVVTLFGTVPGISATYMDGKTVKVVDGGEATHLYGGGYGPSGTVNGSTSITISGGTIQYAVYGGGGSGATVTGDTSITISGGTIGGNVLGGGYGSGVTNSTITISGGTIGMSVYGGGYTKNANSVNVTITIEGGTVKGGVYGGGTSGATVTGTKAFIYNGGTIEGNVDAFDTITVNADLSVKNISAEKTITLASGTKLSVTDFSLTGTDDASITADYTNQITFSGEWNNNGTITVDMTNATPDTVYKLIDYTGTGTITDYGTVSVTGGDYAIADNDLFVMKTPVSKILVNSDYSALYKKGDAVLGREGYYYGINAFADIPDDVSSVTKLEITGGAITLQKDLTLATGAIVSVSNATLNIMDSELDLTNWVGTAGTDGIINLWKGADVAAFKAEHNKAHILGATVEVRAANVGSTDMSSSGLATKDFKDIKDTVITEDLEASGSYVTLETNDEKDLVLAGSVEGTGSSTLYLKKTDSGNLQIEGAIKNFANINITNSGEKAESGKIQIDTALTAEKITITNGDTTGTEEADPTRTIELGILTHESTGDEEVKIINGTESKIIGKQQGLIELAANIKANKDVTIDNKGHLNANVTAGGKMTITNTSANTLIGVYSGQDVNVTNTAEGAAKDVTLQAYGKSSSETGTVTLTGEAGSKFVGTTNIFAGWNETPDAPTNNNGNGTVKLEGTNTFSGDLLVKAASLTNETNGVLNLEQDATLAFGGSTKKVTNAGTINLKGGVTAADVEIGNSGTLNWDLTVGAGNESTLADWTKLTNNGTLSVTVDGNAQTDNTYTLANNASDAVDKSFTLCGYGYDQTIVVGDTFATATEVTYAGSKYKLALNSNDDLVLTVVDAAPVTPISEYQGGQTGQHTNDDNWTYYTKYSAIPSIAFGEPGATQGAVSYKWVVAEGWVSAEDAWTGYDWTTAKTMTSGVDLSGESAAYKFVYLAGYDESGKGVSMNIYQVLTDTDAPARQFITEVKGDAADTGWVGRNTLNKTVTGHDELGRPVITTGSAVGAGGKFYVAVDAKDQPALIYPAGEKPTEAAELPAYNVRKAIGDTVYATGNDSKDGIMAKLNAIEDPTEKADAIKFYEDPANEQWVKDTTNEVYAQLNAGATVVKTPELTDKPEYTAKAKESITPASEREGWSTEAMLDEDAMNDANNVADNATIGGKGYHVFGPNYQIKYSVDDGLNWNIKQCTSVAEALSPKDGFVLNPDYCSYRIAGFDNTEGVWYTDENISFGNFNAQYYGQGTGFLAHQYYDAKQVNDKLELEYTIENEVNNIVKGIEKSVDLTTPVFDSSIGPDGKVYYTVHGGAETEIVPREDIVSGAYDDQYLMQQFDSNGKTEGTPIQISNAKVYLDAAEEAAGIVRNGDPTVAGDTGLAGYVDDLNKWYTESAITQLIYEGEEVNIKSVKTKIDELAGMATDEADRAKAFVEDPNSRIWIDETVNSVNAQYIEDLKAAAEGKPQSGVDVTEKNGNLQKYWISANYDGFSPIDLTDTETWTEYSQENPFAFDKEGDDLAKGYYVAVTDKAGNVTAKELSDVKIDVTDATVAIDTDIAKSYTTGIKFTKGGTKAPENEHKTVTAELGGAAYVTKDLQLTIALNDALSGLDRYELYTLDEKGEEVVIKSASDLKGAAAETVALASSDFDAYENKGAVSYTLKVTDVAGNETTKTFSYNYDTIASGAVTVKKINLSGAIVGRNADGKYYVNDTNYTLVYSQADGAMGSGKGYLYYEYESKWYTANMEQGRDPFTIHTGKDGVARTHAAQISDKAGNLQDVGVTVVVDTKKASITLKNALTETVLADSVTGAPSAANATTSNTTEMTAGKNLEGTFTSNWFNALNGDFVVTIADTNLSSIIIDSTEVYNSGTSYEYTIEKKYLQQGANMRTIVVKDKAGNETKSTITLNYDSANPVFQTKSITVEGVDYAGTALEDAKGNPVAVDDITSFTVKLNATDTSALTTWYSFSVDGTGSWTEWASADSAITAGEGYYRFAAVDSAGNGTVAENYFYVGRHFEYTLGENVHVTYDGEAHGVSVTITDPKGGTGASVYYTLDEGKNWILTENGSYTLTDATADTVSVAFKIEAKGYITEFTESRTIDIAKRQITLQSATISKEYDGTALTAYSNPPGGGTAITDLTAGQTDKGYVSGEEFNYSFTGSQLFVGSSENSFNVSDKTALTTDYNVTKNFGDLSVTKRTTPLTITVKDQERLYDGTANIEAAEKDKTYTVTGELAYGDAISVTLVNKDGSINAGTYADGITATYKIMHGDIDVTGMYANVTVNTGDLIIDKRSVTITSGDATKKYDGTPLTENSTQITAGDGFVGSESYTPNVTGSQTEAGTSKNTFEVSAAAGTNLDNYNIAKIEGALTVTPAAPITITADSNSKMYDGMALTDSGYTYEGTLYAGDELSVTVTGSITDYGTAANKVTGYKIVNAAGKDVTSSYAQAELIDGTLSITKRDVILTSGDATKKYDGTPLTNHNITVTGSGFVTGEGATYSNFASQTLVGSTDNAFDYSLNTGTKVDNYAISTATGTLTVTKNDTQITITAMSAEKMYDGTALTEGGYTYTGKLAAGDYFESVTVVGEITHYGTADNKVTGWVIRNQAGEDVTDCYANISTVGGTLAITKRDVILTSGDATKEYDGTPLTNHNITVTGSGFVTGEGATYSNFASQTLVGSTDNAFDYSLNTGTKVDNYAISTATGTLTVTKNDTQITITAMSAEKMYDGTALTEGGYTYTGKLAAGDYFESVTVVGEITHYGTADNKVTGWVIMHDNGDGTFSDVTDFYANISTVGGTLAITKRDVTLTSADATKEYDGTPLTNDTITVTGSGFVAGEGATYYVIGSQTEIGQSANIFSYNLYDGTSKDDYSIKTVEGTLTVEPSDPIVVGPGAKVVIVEDHECSSTTIGRNASLTLKEGATLATDKLVLNGGTLDVTDGAVTVGDIVVSASRSASEIVGEVDAMKGNSSVTVERGAKLVLDKDMYDTFLDWRRFVSDGVVTVKASEGNDLTQKDIQSLTSLNTVSAVDFQQNLVDLNRITFNKNNNLSVGYENAYGTKRNDSIVLGASAVVTLGSAGGVTDLGEGVSDRVSVGSNAVLDFNGTLKGAESVSVLSGTKATVGGARVQRYTYAAFDDVVGTQRLAVGNYAEVALDSYVGTAKADTLSIGTASEFTAAGDVALGAGADRIAFGNYTDVTFASLTTGEGADKVTVGNYAEVDLGDVDLGDGNDTLTIGTGSRVTSGRLDFGDGKDTLKIGAGSVLEVETLDGLENLTMTMTKGKESTLVISDDASFAAAQLKWGAKYGSQIVQTLA